MVLEEVFKKQCLFLKKDIGVMEPADWNIGLKHVAAVDDGPGTKSGFSIPVFEIDLRMRAHLHFGSGQAIKSLLLPWGLYEIKAAVQY